VGNGRVAGRYAYAVGASLVVGAGREQHSVAVDDRVQIRRAGRRAVAAGPRAVGEGEGRRADRGRGASVSAGAAGIARRRAADARTGPAGRADDHDGERGQEDKKGRRSMHRAILNRRRRLARSYYGSDGQRNRARREIFSSEKIRAITPRQRATR